MTTTISINPRDIGVDGNQVMISPAAYERLTAAEDACYEILSAIQHDPAWLPHDDDADLATHMLRKWERLARREAGHGD
ncbi:hypothetical protein NITHO_2510017 [Nitrolancea hollandica Lb]|uniref:Uncharacterized protein n=2 Tax=Nitrolancea hollandica TaxID=1206749 RepID=I4EG07_9BACT|nr:hypothetical protein NITHO_2510017 [Nitrolancea hollandica Lb]